MINEQEKKDKILEVLNKYKKLNSYVGLKKIYKLTRIKKRHIFKILSENPDIKNYEYSIVGSNKSSGHLWKLE